MPELKEREAEIRHQLGKGVDIKAQRDLFSTWAEDFLRLKETTKITDRQKAHYQVSVRHWKDAFEGYQLDEIHKRKSVDKLDAYLDPPPPEENPSQ